MRGVFPKENKISEDVELKRIPLSDKLYIYMDNNFGVDNEPLVKKGDKVKKYQKVGETKEFCSAPVHSPVTGEVVDVKLHPHPNGENKLAVVIKPTIDTDLPEKTTTKDVLKRIKECGIVGLGGAMFPTHIKLAKPVKNLIINGCECEPYLTADSTLMKREASDIHKGIRIIKKLLKAKNVYVAIEKNKKDAINGMEGVFPIIKLKTRYPQGAEKELIYSVIGKRVPGGKLPLDIGVAVVNVATSYAIFKAVEKNIPLIERVVSVTGDVKNPSNFIVPIGTPFKHLIKQAGGYKGIPHKILCGGPMMGVAQKTTDAALVKGNNGILVFNKTKVQPESEDCIRCGKCIDVCPMNLAPKIIATYSKNEKYDLAKDNYCMDCYECGSCSYVCPSKIDLVGLIKKAKAHKDE